MVAMTLERSLQRVLGLGDSPLAQWPLARETSRDGDEVARFKETSSSLGAEPNNTNGAGAEACNGPIKPQQCSHTNERWASKLA